jgi:hypothetical protein
LEFALATEAIFSRHKPKPGALHQERKQRMKTMSKMVAALLMNATLTFSILSSHAQNLLVDPGFELQTPASAGGWTTFSGFFSTDFAHTGQWSMLDVGFNSIPVTFQQFPAAPGSQWRMTGYGLTPSPLLGDPAFGIIQVTFFDIFGNNLGTVETAGSGTPAKISNPVDGSDTPGEWIFLDTGVATAPAGTAFIQAFTVYVDFSGFIQGVYFDDLSLQVLVKNHGAYVSSIVHNANALLQAGSITEAQAAAMVSTAAMSSGGK